MLVVMIEVAVRTETAQEAVLEVIAQDEEVHQLIHLYVNIQDQGQNQDLALTTKSVRIYKLYTMLYIKLMTNLFNP